jgi:hypothetical protein
MAGAAIDGGTGEPSPYAVGARARTGGGGERRRRRLLACNARVLSPPSRRQFARPSAPGRRCTCCRQGPGCSCKTCAHLREGGREERGGERRFQKRGSAIESLVFFGHRFSLSRAPPRFLAHSPLRVLVIGQAAGIDAPPLAARVAPYPRSGHRERSRSLPRLFFLLLLLFFRRGREASSWGQCISA